LSIRRFVISIFGFVVSRRILVSNNDIIFSMTQHSLTTLSNTSATRLTPLGAHGGLDFTIQNVNETGYIYIGSEGVTSSNYGFRISPNQSISFELASPDFLYAISSIDAMIAATLQTNLEP
jgi:hypothetical protein